MDHEILKIKPSEIIKPIRDIPRATSKQDLIKIHEFTRESRQEPYVTKEISDYFEFTNENDKKYDFLKAKNLIKYNFN